MPKKDDLLIEATRNGEGMPSPLYISIYYTLGDEETQRGVYLNIKNLEIGASPEDVLIMPIKRKTEKQIQEAINSVNIDALEEAFKNKDIESYIKKIAYKEEEEEEIAEEEKEKTPKTFEMLVPVGSEKKTKEILKSFNLSFEDKKENQSKIYSNISPLIELIKINGDVKDAEKEFSNIQMISEKIKYFTVINAGERKWINHSPYDDIVYEMANVAIGNLRDTLSSGKPLNEIVKDISSGKMDIFKGTKGERGAYKTAGKMLKEDILTSTEGVLALSSGEREGEDMMTIGRDALYSGLYKYREKLESLDARKHKVSTVQELRKKIEVAIKNLISKYKQEKLSPSEIKNKIIGFLKGDAIDNFINFIDINIETAEKEIRKIITEKELLLPGLLNIKHLIKAGEYHIIELHTPEITINTYKAAEEDGFNYDIYHSSDIRVKDILFKENGERRTEEEMVDFINEYILIEKDDLIIDGGIIGEDSSTQEEIIRELSFPEEHSHIINTNETQVEGNIESLIENDDQNGEKISSPGKLL